MGSVADTARNIVFAQETTVMQESMILGIESGNMQWYACFPPILLASAFIHALCSFIHIVHST
jgi:hypothetical protein